MAIQWLRCGHHVYVVSTHDGSEAACMMLYHLLLQSVKRQQSAGVSPGQPHYLQYDLDDDKKNEAEKAINDLSQAATGGSLYIIADEVGGYYRSPYFYKVCDKLLTQVSDLHLWASSCFHGHAPDGWQEECLTRPLRSPPAVVREVEQDDFITKHGDVKPYTERGHSGDRPGDCVTCGRDVASFLLSLRVGVTENVTTTATTVSSTNGGTTPPCLQWRDVLVLYWNDISDDSGMMKGLEEASIPVRVMKDDDIEDVSTARSDVVWVTSGESVCGLERKVVICVEDNVLARFYCMSRCTSQLVIVYS
ncbi:uncharacterized protein LOC112567886 [Pomacea canaliculata]|uniref:uncharacterized protein LOC112567886 n=1 Tax=Pomacea canaliculata TaxID=400727 RepID=UPI000D72C560|nr:uncharacterized protein LOC112567886 [Pomacea canaliculata]